MNLPILSSRSIFLLATMKPLAPLLTLRRGPTSAESFVKSRTPIATAAPPSPASGTGDVTSPLAGKLVSIEVTVGQEVQAGAQVATVEAMKMNTYIYAPKTGKIASVQVNPGDAVDEGAVILRIA